MTEKMTLKFIPVKVIAKLGLNDTYISFIPFKVNARLVINGALKFKKRT